MTTKNPFDLLGDDDTEDLSQLIAAQKVVEKAQPPAAQAKQQPAAAAQAKSAKQLPSKPAQAVLLYWMRGSCIVMRDFVSDENSFSNSGFPAGRGAPEDGESGKTSERRGGYGGGPRGAYRGGGRRGGFSNGDVGEGEGERPPRRTFERRSGTGRGNELKREGSGRGNWGSQNDEFPQVTEEVNESEKNLGDEKPAGDRDAADVDKESPTKEPEEKEPEDKEMTLEEYQKVLEEKKKSLQALKTEERKVDVKEFESMQQISSKKANHDVFIKLGSDKDKKKEAAEKEEKAKKAVPITEFLKPAEGERHYNSGGRGRGRGGRSGSKGGGYGVGNPMKNVPAPSIEDPGQFPTLGAK
ncbi:hypothetical protein EZV62_009499 [Acer yangbiense]|uniref:Hyaluronan/mRNA-binding protein domain-containing protein n=1 Tax=Acer yangbiense TaxID=1000413 RepID=A0A5C7I0A6_9ROSI|nr:hypothetical protein EZV62_009499 [Acer yangbiense]